MCTGARDSRSVRPQEPLVHRSQLAGLTRAAECCPWTLGHRADGAASRRPWDMWGRCRRPRCWGRPRVVFQGRLQPQGLHREDKREAGCDPEPLVQTPGRRHGKTSFTHWSPSMCSDLQGTLREVSERTTTYSFNRPGRPSELDGRARVPGWGEAGVQAGQSEAVVMTNGEHDVTMPLDTHTHTQPKHKPVHRRKYRLLDLHEAQCGGIEPSRPGISWWPRG